MRRRGLTLVATLWIVALLLALSLGALGVLEGVRGRVAAHKLGEEARALALSGADYARAMVASRRWNPPRRWTSPPLAGGGCFTVELTSRSIVSTGIAGSHRRTVEVPLR